MIDDDESDGMPFGWSAWPEGQITSGHPETSSWRDPRMVENEDEILLLFAGGSGRHRLTCGWCGAQTRTRSRKTAISWFHRHPCSDDDPTEAWLRENDPLYEEINTTWRDRAVAHN